MIDDIETNMFFGIIGAIAVPLAMWDMWMRTVTGIPTMIKVYSFSECSEIVDGEDS